jgi:hypothetical protein
MIYLIEFGAYDEVAGAETTQRFGTDTFVTRPGDLPANAAFDGRVMDPGNFEVFLFGRGRTFGQSDVGVGVVKLANPDGALDYLIDHALDGRAIRIFAIADKWSPWSSRSLLFSGLLDQAEFAYREVTLRMRDRLDVLRKTLQQATYLGTTINGGLAFAEGNVDLKDKPKPEAFGHILNVPPVVADPFDLIYDIGVNGLSAVLAVRDRGVVLTASADYASLAALKAATVTSGQYATCLAEGRIRLGSLPNGDVSVDAVEGATLADRSAARIAQRILLRLGMIAGTDFNAASFDALHALAPAECGIWLGTSETDALKAISMVLDSVGAYLVPDATGKFFVGRLVAPSGAPVAEIDELVILDEGSGIDRLATNDQGGGVRAKKLTVRFGYNYLVQGKADLDKTVATEAVKSFAVEEWRQTSVTSAAVEAILPDAPELTFDTLLVSEVDATAEATRRLALYSVRRDLINVPLDATEAAGIALGDVVRLSLPRFGLDAGRLFVVLGMTPTWSTGQTSLSLWG